MNVLIRVSPSDPRPLFEQVAASIRGAIADGSVAPGARLPVARELAESLDVNVHTVLHGYQQLRDEGLIELRRGRGAVVTADAAAQSRLRAAARELVQVATDHGLDLNETIDLIRKEMT